MKRSEQIESNTWDLSSLAKDAAAWEKDLARLKKAFRKARSFKGTLSRSPDSLYAFLCYLRDTEMEAERIGSWAFLSYEADSSNPDVQKRMMMYQDAADAFTQDISWYSTELISIDDALVRQWMKEPRYAEFRVYLKKSLREKKHILSEKEEHLLSLYAPVSGSAEKAFMDLNNIELSFDGVFGEKLTHGSYAKFLKSQDESVRETAYRNYYRAYDAHKNTIADLYISSVKEDIFTSKARNYRSSLDAALFPDNIPESVYRSLIDAVHGAFPLLHSYYETKAEVLGRLGQTRYTIQRSKGLGENDPQMMSLTTMDPSTRRLIRIRMEDEQRTYEMFDILLGDNITARKQFISDNGARYLALADY